MNVDTPSEFSSDRDLSIKAFFASILILVVWTIWQSVGIEAMRLPWEDDILYTLPAVNWATDGNFSLPQLGHFMDADIGWRWHMPLFPTLAAVWVKMAGYQLTVLRMFSLLPAAFMALLLARCCARLAGQKDWPWVLFWLGVILGDKIFVMNSLCGRMEFWCLLAVIGSVTLVLDSRKPPAFLFAGALLGLAVGFHPLAFYFLPGLLWMSTTGGLHASDATGFRCKPAILFTLGFGLVILTIVLWFLADWRLTKLQFLAQVQGTVGGSLAQNARSLFAGLKYNFRFQPILPYIMLAAMGVHLWHILRRRHPDMPGKAVPIGLMLLMAGLMGFLLQEATFHVYYFSALVLVAMLLMAGALPILRQASARAQKAALFILFLLLANNLVFIAAKTRTVWRNRDLLDPAPMNAFLDAELRGVNHCVLPSNLWLYGKQHQLNFRMNFLPVIGQSKATYQTYFQSLLDWQPEIIILDRGDARGRPDQFLAPEQLAAAGYVEQAHFDRVFRDRFLYYDGYRLVVYHRVDTLPR